MNFDANLFIRCLDAAGYACLLLLFIGVLCLLTLLAHFILTMPMRRMERARMFLDQIAAAIRQGKPVEETLISLAASRDLTMGARFHLVTAWLEQGLILDEALAKVPRFLPAQINAMLAAGRRVGDVQKVLPACRQLLTDAVSHTRAALNYLVILTFVVTPAGILVAWLVKVFVMPKFRQLSHELGVGTINAGLAFVYDHLGSLIALQAAILLLIWLAVLGFMMGPRFVAAFPWAHQVNYRLPWRRKRLQRDFSTMLAILLDSGLPEREAVEMAADCTANKVFRRRAHRAAAGLRDGQKLTEAVSRVDDSGEFRWRLNNAVHGHGGFLKTLAGWHESLDAKAFQEEQAAAHGITSALVLWSGLYVGIIVISVFAFLISITNAGVLW